MGDFNNFSSDGDPRIDNDILRCRADIRRLLGAVTPFNDEKSFPTPEPAAVRKDDEHVIENKNPVPIKIVENKPVKPARVVDVYDAKPAAVSGKGSDGDISESALPPAGSAGDKAGRNGFAIPKFDLSDKMMAEHRKAVAARRRSPEKGIDNSAGDPQSRPVSSAIEQLLASEPQPDSVIAEIVARDIEKLRRTFNHL